MPGGERRETFAASFPQVAWLVGSAQSGAWRGQLDFWVFGDGEVGMVTGSVNGPPGILPHGLQATVEIRLTAPAARNPVSITPPGPDDEQPNAPLERRPETSDRASANTIDWPASYRVIRYLQAPPEGATPDAIAVSWHVEADRLP